MQFLDNIPQPLYKYRIWEESCKENQMSRRLLTHNEVYLASVDQFNDPFDAALPFRYKEADLTPDNIYLKLIELGREAFPDLSTLQLEELCFKRQQSGIFETGRYWKEHHPHFKKRINDAFGMLSLTSKRDNLLMWSHYADSHRGFCVGLDKYTLFNCCGGNLFKVFYDQSFPEIDMFPETPIALSVLTGTKSTHWSYEDEYRLIKINSAREVVTLPNEAIIEINLGCKMSEEHKNVIYEIAEKKFPHANVFETQPNNENFQLDFLPILRGNGR